ncbi:hypothetical protein P152DRAFT_206786 [Eremomyces bilateralis CBS 781.70]|uniref:SH3 and Ded_cyto domain-containing protein n=1 Tax=Eremomyces bilateralis CBS 781.70 TaxID=1392243 RepID=A0A6G1FT23_9PEZI|nr:uncharacterized protein P152DRAFT_206786 [Eremomyces bilateralis CBS 781.70]KAF1808880.1 hypothetical protein P152DRAFT_206786 [Eremomyces bilateralis CBS 781.70]
MPWRPLPRIAFGICVYPFQPTSAADLPLEIGDELYIIEQGGADGSWYRGYLVAPPSLLAGLTSVKGQTLEARVFSGIFPRCCVEVREVLGEDRMRSRLEDAAPLPPDSSGRLESRNSHAEKTPNGVLTPTESSTPTPNAQAARDRSARLSKTDAGVPNGAQKTKPNLTLGTLASRRTTRSELSAPFTFPLSPLSVGPRDLSSPRPPAPVPMLKIGDETPTSTQEPLVDEIASCLREWHSTKLHELLLARRYHLLDKMSNLVQRLDTSRRQLLHKVLTDHELSILRESAVWDLVNGNKMLSGEVVVRNPFQGGRILTADDSPIELTKLQSMMSLLSERPVPHVDEHTMHHIFVDIAGSTKQEMPPVTIALHLCTKAPGEPLRPLSEMYAIDFSHRDTSGAVADTNLKTLFVDLASTDIGEGAGSGNNLYLAFKILANEPLRSQAEYAMPRESTSSRGAHGVETSGTIKGGRRSLMWGQKGRRPGEPLTKPDSRPPTGGDAARGFQDPPRPSTNQRATSSRDNKTVKRTVGGGIIRIDQIAKRNGDAEVEMEAWAPFMPWDDPPAEEGWDPLLPEILPSASGHYRRFNAPKSLSLCLQAFSHPDAESLIKNTPTLLHRVTQTRKIGFSGAPTKPRSDIYITLSSAYLPRNGFLAHPKSGTAPLGIHSGSANLQLTLEVRRSTGERIESCIYPACNSAGHTAWRTTAVERGEPWNLTIRLAIDPEDVPGCHIVMSVADAPGFPFALCWMPLWTAEAFMRDGDHYLTLYSYDEYTSSMISGRGAYLGLPWSSKKKDETVVGPMAALRLRTYLCSTQYSQDPTLLGLLKWRDESGEHLVQLLRRFVFVPEIEIVKLLNEVFDALFELLVEYAESEEYEDLVFNALVFVLGIVHDRRFKLGPLVDGYAETRFKYPFATACLIRSFQRLLANPTDPETSRKLRATFKVGSHIFKFIVNARQQQEEKEAGIGITNRKPTFTKDVKNIFNSLESLMKNPAPILIGTKTLVVQHFHTWLPELAGCMVPMEILKIATSFIDSCADVQGKLVLYLFVLIIHLGQVPVFKLPDVRRPLLTSTIRWLAPYWGKVDTVTDQWKDQVRLCCSVVASQINELGQEACEYIPKLVDSYRAIQSSPRTMKKSLSLLFPTTYPSPSRPTEKPSEFEESLGEIAAVLAAITNLPTTIHLDLPKQELAEFLFGALQTYISILNGDAFPTSWLSTHIYHHKSTLRTLEKLASILIDSFLPHPDDADQFNTDLWRAFFDALLKLVGSNALALETFPEQKRRAVWKIAGDVRELGADLLRRTWEAIGWETSAEDRKQYGLEKLGGYQVQYVPGLVAPIVELCLTVHEGLRITAIEVLQTMIVSEWTLSQDLLLIQGEVIEALERIFKNKVHTESILQKLFIGELIDAFEPLARNSEDGLFVAVKNLVAVVDELLDLLVAVHSTEASGEAFHIMDTLKLMEFLRDMQKEDIYIRYVHQLAKLQLDARSPTEAGLALRLHADLYDWDPLTTIDASEDPEFPPQTLFERKEQLYFQMIKHFEEGQSWENALDSYVELAQQYEHNVFDFNKLARTQRAMATIYESIAKGQRQHPRYFRVQYKGLGWPMGLRDKQFIFQAPGSDKSATFTDRMQEQHPSAQIISSETDDDLEGQYLVISPVAVQKDITHPIYHRTKVAQPVRDYLLAARPHTFTTPTRRQANVENLDKTTFETAETFPTILRRSEIIATQTVSVPPLHAALERITRKTSELASMERKAGEGDESNMTTFTEFLMVMVDPKSENGCAKYRNLLPTRARDSMGLEDEEADEEQEDPLHDALRMSLIEHVLAIKRALGVFSRSSYQATRDDLTGRFEHTFAPELEALAPASNPFGLLSALGSPSSSWQHGTPPATLRTRNGTTSTAPDLPDLASTILEKEKRADKMNRLSLTFLKRTSILDPINRSNAKNTSNLPLGSATEVNGTNHAYSPMKRSISQKRPSRDGVDRNISALPQHVPASAPATVRRKESISISGRGSSGLQALFSNKHDEQARGSATEGDRSGSLGHGGPVKGVERPETGRSGSSHGGAVGVGGPAREVVSAKGGTVKKRFSLLNIGRKASQASVKGRYDDVMEE